MNKPRGRPRFRNYDAQITFRISEELRDRLHEVHNKDKWTFEEFLTDMLKNAPLPSKAAIIRYWLCVYGKSINLRMIKKDKSQIRFKCDQCFAKYSMWLSRGKARSFNRFLITVLEVSLARLRGGK